MIVSDAAQAFVEATLWADECREYAKRCVVGKRWQMTPGDLEAIDILIKANADEFVAKKGAGGCCT